MTQFITDPILSIPDKKFYAVLNGNVMHWLRRLPDESVDALVTSSPYFRARDYSPIQFLVNSNKESLLQEAELSKISYETLFRDFLKANPDNKMFIPPPQYNSKKEKWGTSVRLDMSTTWGGREGCHHEWDITTESTYWNSLNEDFNERWGGASGERKQEFSQQSYDYYADCVSCGAWRGQLGREKDPELFIDHLVGVFTEASRAVKSTGSLWINIADSRSKDGSGYLGVPERLMIRLMDDVGLYLQNRIVWFKPNHMPFSGGNRLAPSWEYLFFFTKLDKYHFDLSKIRVPQKFPLDVARRMFQDSEAGVSPFNKGSPDARHGYFARGVWWPDQMAYRKALWAERGEDSGKQFSKEKRYEGKYDGNTDHEQSGSPRARNMRDRDQKHASLPHPSKMTRENHSGNYSEDGEYLGSSDGLKNPGDVFSFGDFWRVTTRSIKDMHFAPYPEELVELALTPTVKEGGVVIDPFLGTGTTMKKARDLGLSAIGIDLNPMYINLAKERVKFGQRTIANTIEWISKV